MESPELEYKKKNRIRIQTEKHAELAEFKSEMVYQDALRRPGAATYFFEPQECLRDTGSYFVFSTADPELAYLVLPIEYAQRSNNRTGSYRAVILPNEEYTCFSADKEKKVVTGDVISQSLFHRQILDETERRNKIMEQERAERSYVR